MTYQRLAYGEADSASDMHADCAACAGDFPSPRGAIDAESMAVTTPSLLREAFSELTAKPSIEVSEAAAHLASRLHLHLD